MSDLKELLDREARLVDAAPDALGSVLRRRDRKRRNQRIAAGVVGIAVFVAAVWVVTSVGSLDRSETPVAPGGAETGPAETGPVGRPAPPLAHASAAPDVVKEGPCSDGARSRLELTDMGDRIKVRFEVYRSPVGHSWRIRIGRTQYIPADAVVFFRGTRVAGDSGDFGMSLRVPWKPRKNRFGAEATDTQTGQRCSVDAEIYPLAQ